MPHKAFDLLHTARDIAKRVSLYRFGKDPRFPDWEGLLNADLSLWEDAKKAVASGPRILIATNVGGFSHTAVLESMLAVALTLRGARVEILLCDAVLPACFRAEVTDIPDPTIFETYGLADILCEGCIVTGNYIFNPLGLITHRLSSFISKDDVVEARSIAANLPAEQIPSFRYEGIAVGEHANAGTLRYFARGDLNTEPKGIVVLRRYLEASLLTTIALRRLVNDRRFDASCFHHGIYVPQGIVGEVCRSTGVRVVNWNPAYRKNCFIFSHDDTYHHTLLSEPSICWEDMEWTPVMEDQILSYLGSRWYGQRDWIWFHEKPEYDVRHIVNQLGLDGSKPIIGMLTNVMWDAQLHYRANAFRNMLEWVVETIRYFGKRDDVQLLIRIHPAEIRGTAKSRQPLKQEIDAVFHRLPKNIFVIPPESNVSTYAAMSLCNSVIIYGTKTGVELTSIGIPVVVAGEAWIRNKGITKDATSITDYFQILDELPYANRLPPEILRRARKYAYHFFFRRMIPLPFIEPSTQYPPYRLALSNLCDLLPGKSSKGLEVICDGILHGTPFIYRAEELGVHDLA